MTSSSKQRSRKFRRHSEIFAIITKCWRSGNFATIAKFRYVAKLVYSCPPHKTKQCTVTKVKKKKRLFLFLFLYKKKFIFHFIKKNVSQKIKFLFLFLLTILFYFSKKKKIRYYT